MDSYLGIIVCFSGSFIPRGWAACNGQTMLVNQNQALFSLLGTTYGGDGRTNFKLPDLRGRTAVSAGQSPYHNYRLGELAGSASVTLSTIHIPEHTHDSDITFHLTANAGPGIDPTVNDGYPADHTAAYATSGDSTMMAPEYNVTIGNAGSGLPLNTRSPFLALTYIICVNGLYPARQ